MIKLLHNKVTKILIMIVYVINMHGHAKGGGAFGVTNKVTQILHKKNHISWNDYLSTFASTLMPY